MHHMYLRVTINSVVEATLYYVRWGYGLHGKLGFVLAMKILAEEKIRHRI